MPRYVGVASVQRSAFPGDTGANVAEMENYIEGVVFEAPFVDIICFPELCVQGYSPDFAELAEPVPGPAAERFQKKAREVKKWIIPGSMFEKDGDKIYNTMLLISPEGEIVEKYRKMFPWSPLEPSEPGSRFSVVELPGIGKIGMCICYDMWFPEVVRTLVSMGAEVIFHPTMTPSSLRDQEKIVNLGNAVFNQVYFVGSSICGPHGLITLAGHSMIVDPEGLILQEAGDVPTILTEIIDLDRVTMVRKHGTKGLVPMLKHLKHYDHEFPIYACQKAGGPGIDRLGKIPTVEGRPSKIEI